MFFGWTAFYQMTGEAGAALVGLLFIVATLSSRQQQDGVHVGVQLFTTPTVFHLSLVLTVSALALAPPSPVYRPAAGMFVIAIVGCLYAGPVAIRISRLATQAHWSDFWLYGAAPCAAYLALAGATGAAWAGAPHSAHCVGLVVLILLALGIRNAWDLITWLAPRRIV
jgi:ABC-type polysaccharide/polyol phosphate export permease